MEEPVALGRSGPARGCLTWPPLAQVWVRDVREAVELLDAETGQRVPKDKVRLNRAQTPRLMSMHAAELMTEIVAATGRLPRAGCLTFLACATLDTALDAQ